ncbi:MAG: hypothetical protein D3908_01070 [Candidatus Electrothrix sp. AUS4]|nr:hypothetical protein [Candidatus Electrothrix sp. AUS4]
MVVKKDQLHTKKQETVNTFEKFFFILLGLLSLVFLFIISWILLTGDDVILLHGSNITPRHLCLLFYLESFLLGQIIKDEHTNNNSELEQFAWSFSPAYHL